MPRTVDMPPPITKPYPPIPEPDPKWIGAWEQPSKDDIMCTEEVAYMTKKSFDKLPTYNASVPTGQWTGKMWKSDNRHGKVLHWYDCSTHPGWTTHYTLYIELVELDAY